MLYHYDHSQIELLHQYLYEITVYAIGKDRAELIVSKFLTSKTPLKIKKPIKVEKRKGYIIEKSIQLLGAPQEFIDRYFLKPCK